jgi:hypothetical protein
MRNRLTSVDGAFVTCRRHRIMSEAGSNAKTFTRSELGAHNSQCALFQGTRHLAVQMGRRKRVSEHLTDNLGHVSC